MVHLKYKIIMAAQKPCEETHKQAYARSVGVGVRKAKTIAAVLIGRRSWHGNRQSVRRTLNTALRDG